MGRLSVGGQLEGIMVDVVDGRQDDPCAVLFDPHQNRLGPRWGAITNLG